MYLPLAALVAAVVAGAITLVGRLGRNDAVKGAGVRHAAEVAAGSESFRIVRWSPALLALAILAVATVRRAALYSDPIALWTETAELNPQLARPRANLAQMHYELALKIHDTDPAGARREAEASRVEYERSIALKPGDPLLHYNYGKLSDLLGDSAGAERAFRKAIELTPDYPSALTDLGNLLFGQKRYEEASTYYVAMMRLDPKNSHWPINYGLTMRRLGRRDDAQDFFRKATELTPPMADSWANLAEIFLDKGDLAAAEDAIAKAVAIQPNHAYARQVAEKIQAQRTRVR